MLLYDPKWHIPKSKFIEAAMRKVGLLARPIPAPRWMLFTATFQIFASTQSTTIS